MRQLFRPLLALFCALNLSSIVSAQSEQRPQILVETTKGNFIIERKHFAMLKKLVKDLDPKAFITTADASNDSMPLLP